MSFGRGASRLRRPRAEKSDLFAHPVRMVSPSGLNATAKTSSGCSIGLPRRCPRAASQSWTVPDREPVRNAVPSGLNATAQIGSSSSSSLPRGCPVVASQSRTVLSRLPVRMVLPSRLNAAETGARWENTARSVGRRPFMMAKSARAACCKAWSCSLVAKYKPSTIQSRPLLISP